MTLPSPLQPLWRRGLQWRFRLFQQHRVRHVLFEEVAGLRLLILPEVFNPALYFSSEFFGATLNSLDLPPHAKVLDLGTGSGLLGILCAQRGAQVDSIDINPAAVRCAKINVLLHELEREVSVLLGDLFETSADKIYDWILFNPPYLSGKSRSMADKAFFGPELANAFAVGCAAQLAPAGQALVILSSLADEQRFLGAAAAKGLTSTVLATKTMPAETLTIYRWTRTSASTSR